MKVKSVWSTEWKTLRDGVWWYFQPNEVKIVPESFRGLYPEMLIEIEEIIENVVEKKTEPTCLTIIDNPKFLDGVTTFEESIKEESVFSETIDISGSEEIKPKKKAGRPKGSKNKKPTFRGRKAKRIKPRSKGLDV